MSIVLPGVFAQLPVTLSHHLRTGWAPAGSAETPTSRPTRGCYTTIWKINGSRAKVFPVEWSVGLPKFFRDKQKHSNDNASSSIVEIVYFHTLFGSLCICRRGAANSDAPGRSPYPFQSFALLCDWLPTGSTIFITFAWPGACLTAHVGGELALHTQMR